MSSTKLTLRTAHRDDARQVFAWRNDPWIVSLGSSRRTVAWEEHRQWFDAVLADASRLLLIAQADGHNAGTVRIDQAGEDAAVITIYLMQQFTGRGLGVRAIDAACDCAFRQWPALTKILARIRADNTPSQKAFAKAGFCEELSCAGGDHVVFSRRRPRNRSDELDKDAA